MVPQSNVAQMCGLKGKDAYVNDIIDILRRDTAEAAQIRQAVTECFGLIKAGADLTINPFENDNNTME